MSESIRLFVGCAANGEDLESQAVLEHSLRKHCSRPVDILWMQLSRDKQSPFYSNGSEGWQTQRWSTPFSGFRWAVPHLCGFEGRALYCDSDVMFMADVAELWDQPINPGKVVLAKGGTESWRFCVSLWDCGRASIHIKPIGVLRKDPLAHSAMVQRFRGAPFVQAFDGNWNCIDGEVYSDLHDPEIKAIHYSSEAHQPQLIYAVPRLAAEGREHWFDGKIKPHWRNDLQEMFSGLLAEAIAAGRTPESYRPETLFGPYRKQSHAAGYRSHQWAQ